MKIVIFFNPIQAVTLENDVGCELATIATNYYVVEALKVDRSQRQPQPSTVSGIMMKRDRET
jgi:hypothetical protein